MKERRPVKLHFFDKAIAQKCLDLCSELGYNGTISERPDQSYDFASQDLTATERRNFISKWSDKTIEVIK